MPVGVELRILFFGDVVGRPGREGLRRVLPGLRQRFAADLVIVNAENAAGGLGIDAERARELLSGGADVLTLGDHAFQKKESWNFLDQSKDLCVRPANYPDGAPGAGWVVKTLASGVRISVTNLLGRVFVNSPLDCPFQVADRLCRGEFGSADVRILDMHAEATSEKMAMGWFLDGRVSAVLGTHTHVQTADERVLPLGTAFISDAGMCGPWDSVIGMQTKAALQRFQRGLPLKYEVGEGAAVVQGVCVTVDSGSGKASRIERIQERP